MNAHATRIAIAQELGWTKCRLANKGAGAPEKRPSPHGVPPRRNCEAPIPNYPDDANAALEFAKKLASEGWNAEAGMGTDGTWECTFYKRATSTTREENMGVRELNCTEEHYGAGDTLALAICEAGLKSKGLWKE